MPPWIAGSCRAASTGHKPMAPGPSIGFQRFHRFAISRSQESCAVQDLPNDSLPRLVASRAAENPSAFAVVSPQGTYTFGEVLRRAQLLATALLEEASFGASSSSERQRQGSWQGRRSEGHRELSAGLLSCRVPLVEEAEGSLSLSSVQDGNESFNFLVGLMVSPGLWMVAGPLGCWMAGRGYFALDSSHPTERIQQMAQDAWSPSFPAGPSVTVSVGVFVTHDSVRACL